MHNNVADNKFNPNCKCAISSFTASNFPDSGDIHLEQIRIFLDIHAHSRHIIAPHVPRSCPRFVNHDYHLHSCISFCTRSRTARFSAFEYPRQCLISSTVRLHPTHTPSFALQLLLHGLFIFMEPPVGFEPTTRCLQNSYSNP